MQSSAKVVCIPPILTGAMWPHVGPHLLQRHMQATGANLKQAFEDVHTNCSAILDGEAQLWCVMDGKRVLASWITVISLEPEGKVVTVAGVTAQEMAEWGDEIEEAMADFARAEGAVRIGVDKGGK